MTDGVVRRLTEIHFLREDAIAGMMKRYISEADDEDAGDFRYFLHLPDTPASTYHIEFRNGSGEEDLLMEDYETGKPASGFLFPAFSTFCPLLHSAYQKAHQSCPD